MLLQITRPKIVMFGNIPGSDIFRNIHQYKEAVRIPGFLILGIEAPINFANITYLNDRLDIWKISLLLIHVQETFILN